MADRLELIQILFQNRNARNRGPLRSAQFNDNMIELSHDLSAFVTQWNNRLVPLTATLPNEAGTDLIDAFNTGLDGKTLYVNSAATSVSDTLYYNTTNVRPYTIYEQFSVVYSAIDDLQTTLESQVSAISFGAAQVPIADAGALYTATNVESALAEVMTAVNAISIGALDLTAVAQHYLPGTDNLYDLGSTGKRIRDLYVGPGSVKLISKVADGGGHSNKTFLIRIASGKLEFVDGSTVALSLDSSGATFPAGLPVGDINDLGDVVISSPADNEVLAYNQPTNKWINQTAAEAGLVLTGDSRLSDDRDPTAHAAEHTDGTDDIQSASALQIGLMTTAYATKLDAIETNADVTDSFNVGLAGALMDDDFTSEGLMKRTTSGVYTIVPDITDTYVVASGVQLEGEIGFFNVSGLMATASGLNWDVNNSTLGVGTDNPNTVAGVDIAAQAGPLMVPRYTTAERDTISGIADAMIIFNTTEFKFQGVASGVWVNFH